jgi:hypothetical protein
LTAGDTSAFTKCRGTLVCSFWEASTRWKSTCRTSCLNAWTGSHAAELARPCRRFPGPGWTSGRFLLQGVVQGVVVNGDVQRGSGATVDDTRGLTRATQAAARSGALFITRKGDHFHVEAPMLAGLVVESFNRRLPRKLNIPRDQEYEKTSPRKTAARRMQNLIRRTATSPSHPW